MESSKNEESVAQNAAERIKGAALSAAKGLSRAQAERAATAAARYVNAYGQKEEGSVAGKKEKKQRGRWYRFFGAPIIPTSLFGCPVILSQLDLTLGFGGLPKEITMGTNGWTDVGHALNQVYDILYVMGVTILLLVWEVKVEYFLMLPFCMMLVDISL